MQNQVKFTDDRDVSDAIETGESILARLRDTCAIAIDAYEKALGSRQLTIVMLIYRLQDHIALTKVRDLLATDRAGDAWVDRWRPDSR